jgi:hypothetical protein
MSRHFITKAQVDALVERGETRLEVDDKTTLTDVARERALERGIAVVRVDGPARTQFDASPSGTSSNGASANGDPEVRSAVRSAILAALGEAPRGLDDAIDKVLKAP